MNYLNLDHISERSYQMGKSTKVFRKCFKQFQFYGFIYTDIYSRCPAYKQEMHKLHTLRNKKKEKSLYDLCVN
uniref:Uncharacterized protein n=1 Tax=Rhizophora mucronata TaxID=61149 RepID=A0A2P2LUE7_RHIMU